MQDLSIERVHEGNLDLFWTLPLNDKGYYEECLTREIDIVFAILSGQAVGYALLNWAPKYAYFKVHNMPEIQDLNVLRDHRARGIGRRLIKHCEGLARGKGCTEMGIGVGLDSSFGAAQRLYVKMGYIPDGQGVSYDRKQVSCGDFKPIDDQLCLMMTKLLS